MNIAAQNNERNNRFALSAYEKLAAIIALADTLQAASSNKDGIPMAEKTPSQVCEQIYEKAGQLRRELEDWDEAINYNYLAIPTEQAKEIAWMLLGLRKLSMIGELPECFPRTDIDVQQALNLFEPVIKSDFELFGKLATVFRGDLLLPNNKTYLREYYKAAAKEGDSTVHYLPWCDKYTGVGGAA